MHYLHKILVYIPDLPINTTTYDKDALIDEIRHYAENTTDEYHMKAFDWRDTDSAGRWSDDYPENVIFAKDDIDRFIREVNQAVEAQKLEIYACLAQLENTIGIDLKKIVSGILSRDSYLESKDGVDCMTAYYLYCISAHLNGEYRFDSYIFDAHKYTSRVFPNNIAHIKENPEKWALVMFDYHN